MSLVLAICFLSFRLTPSQSQCSDPIDLNTASLSELDALPYVTSTTAQLIIDFRPICSPLELTYSPKKISGITQNRVNTNWKYYSDETCDASSCCKATASCDDATPAPTTSTTSSNSYSYTWITGDWSDCSADCDTGTQERSVTCQQTYESTISTVIDAYCESDINAGDKPVSKQVCNTDECPSYSWITGEWRSCVSSSDSSDSCEQKRNVTCFETVTAVEVENSNCDASSKPDTTQSCDNCARTATSAANTPTDVSEASGSNVESVQLDVLQTYNHEKCNTEDYYNLPDSSSSNLLIARRGCAPDLWLFVKRTTIDSDTKSLNSTNWKLSVKMVKDLLNDDTSDSDNFEDASDEWNGYLAWECMFVIVFFFFCFRCFLCYS